MRGKDQLLALRDFLGFDRNVIVQATCHGADNSRAGRCAARSGRPRPRRRDRPPGGHRRASCDDLHDAGVRGVRFNFVKRLVDPTPRRATTASSSSAIAAAGLARRRLLRGRRTCRALGLVHARCRRTGGRRPHGPARTSTKPVDGPEFGLFLRLMREHDERLVAR